VSICIIFNPTARGERAKKFQKSLETLHEKFALKPTQSAGAARRLAAEAVVEGYSTVIAAGGDGTLNEVLNGIADVPGGLERVRLGVLPLGTINVFARELRIPLKLGRVWPVLEAGHEVKLDIGCAEFESPNGTEKRLFLQLAGAGVDARSVELVSWELKKKIGPAAYLVAGLQALGAHQPPITVRNGTREATGNMILIGNGRFYGGSYPIFHKGDLQDGLLDAVVFEKVNWKNLPLIALDFSLGRFFKEGRTTYLQGSELTLRSGSRAALQLDGEFAGELPAQITVIPKRLRVIAPRLNSNGTDESNGNR
jgi:diacylglycerol kinase (ATP)